MINLQNGFNGWLCMSAIHCVCILLWYIQADSTQSTVCPHNLHHVANPLAKMIIGKNQRRAKEDIAGLCKAGQEEESDQCVKMSWRTASNTNLNQSNQKTISKHALCVLLWWQVSNVKGHDQHKLLYWPLTLILNENQNCLFLLWALSRAFKIRVHVCMAPTWSQCPSLLSSVFAQMLGYL